MTWIVILIVVSLILLSVWVAVAGASEPARRRRAGVEMLDSSMLQTGRDRAPDPPVDAWVETPSEETSPGYEFDLVVSHYDDHPSSQDLLQQSHACWKPAGSSVTVQGFSIDCGMLYVGAKLQPIRRWSGAADPALIDPRKLAAKGDLAAACEAAGYYPSYTEISAVARDGYLRWLAGGRQDPETPICLVFLYFYGLERRLLFDAVVGGASEVGAAERAQILAEVERLLGVYSSNRSFRGYARRFLEYLDLKDGGLEHGDAHDRDPSAGSLEEATRRWLAERGPGSGTTRGLSLSERILLGRHVDARRPIPGELAFAWLVRHPSTSLRTPGTRCPDEFRELFLLRYRQTFGDGMVVSTGRKSAGGSVLTLEYYPASGGLDRVYRTATDVFDVDRLTRPVLRLEDLASRVQREIDSFSRWVGKQPGPPEDVLSGTLPLDALALLPRELVASRVGAEVDRFIEPVTSRLDGRDIAAVPTAELLDRWPSSQPGKLTKVEATAFADLLSALGFGIEPDMRFGSPNPSRFDTIAVFRLPADGVTLDPAPSDAFAGATLLLHLSATVAVADENFCELEREHLHQHLEEALELSPIDRLRLRAHLAWLLACPPDFRGIRRRAGRIDLDERENLGRFLLTVACADGRIDAREIQTLETVYDTLGLAPKRVHSELHSLAAQRPTVGEAARSVEAAVPDKSAPVDTLSRGLPGSGDGGFVLDADRIAQVRSNSARAAMLLRDIFEDEDEGEDGDRDEHAAEPGDGAATAAESTEEALLEESPEAVLEPPADHWAPLGLESAHRAFLEAFLEAFRAGGRCDRAVLEALGRDHDVMAIGAVESINERAFEAWDEPLIETEDDGYYAMNEELLEELLDAFDEDAT